MKRSAQFQTMPFLMQGMLWILVVALGWCSINVEREDTVERVWMDFEVCDAFDTADADLLDDGDDDVAEINFLPKRKEVEVSSTKCPARLPVFLIHLFDSSPPPEQV